MTDWNTARYKCAAIARFNLSARGTIQTIKDKQLWADWAQEIELAAHAAKKQGLRGQDVWNFFARSAYAALSAMGFRRAYLGKKNGNSIKGSWGCRELPASEVWPENTDNLAVA